MTNSSRTQNRRAALKLGLIASTGLGLLPTGIASAAPQPERQEAPGLKLIENTREIINVRSFGAVGNGAVDDTGPIQRAIDRAAVAGGGAVYLPEGAYKLRQGLVVRAPNTTVIGSGKGSVLQVAPGTVGITVLGDESRIIDLHMRGAGGESRAPGRDARVAATAITPPDPNPYPANEYWVDKWFHDGTIGVEGVSAKHLVIRGCYFERFSQACIKLTSGNDHYVDQCGFAGGTGAYGIWVVNADAALVSSSSFAGLFQCVRFDPVGYRYNMHSFVGCEFDSSTWGAIFEDAGQPYGVVFHGCRFKGNSQQGLYSKKCQGMRIIGCTFLSNR
ncbi:MAG: right-handed parallel beta-helix repeat-containing protein [Chloroflexi bacterium]|nr:right-handed parallel beta-helix repeat-containing protein [Chloroflexota bacterium]